MKERKDESTVLASSSSVRFSHMQFTNLNELLTMNEPFYIETEKKPKNKENFRQTSTNPKNFNLRAHKGLSWHRVSEHLLKIALARRTKDNVSVLFIRFWWAESLATNFWSHTDYDGEHPLLQVTTTVTLPDLRKILLRRLWSSDFFTRVQLNSSLESFISSNQVWRIQLNNLSLRNS